MRVSIIKLLKYKCLNLGRVD